MALTLCQAELERHGFIFDNPTEEAHALLMAVWSGCCWELLIRHNITVFVHNLAPRQDLTLDRIHHDLEELPERVNQLHPGGCPPFGFSRARLIIIVYLVEAGGAIQPDALQRINATPKTEWCSMTFLAAQDANGYSHFMEGNTPIWGRTFYPLARYFAALLTGRAVPDDPPNISSYSMWINIFSIALIVFLYFQDRNNHGILGGIMIVFFVVAVFRPVARLVYLGCVSHGRKRQHMAERQNALLKKSEMRVL